MKKTVTLTLLLMSNFIFSQNKSSDWKLFDKEPLIYKIITKSSTVKIKDLKLVFKWDSKMYYSENLGYLGGVNPLKIYRNNQLITTISSIKDEVALGKLVFTFYDYNFDGNLDFSFRRECGKNCFFSYYIFDKSKNKFIHAKEWDYLRIQKINHEKHLIKTQPDGMEENSEIFKVRGIQLIKETK